MFQQLLTQADNIAKSRSSVITPLQWTLGIVLAMTSGVISVKAPEWIQETFIAASLVVLLVLLAAYVYFAIKDPSALRSERYQLIRTALDRDTQGNSLNALKNIIDVTEPRALGPDESKQLGPGDE